MKRVEVSQLLGLHEPNPLSVPNLDRSGEGNEKKKLARCTHQCRQPAGLDNAGDAIQESFVTATDGN